MQKIITLLKYIFIGIVQGISEILPISSSGHLAILYNIFNIQESEQLNLTVFLHLASSIALCIYFKNEIIELIKGSFDYLFLKQKNNKSYFLLSIYLIVATIPSIIIGFVVKPIIESYFSNVTYVCINLIITSVILLFHHFLKEKKNGYTFKNTLLIGIAQCFAIFPGISRSGTTMFIGKLSGLEMNKNKRFSFLLLLPISIGSSILSMLDIVNTKMNHEYILLCIVSLICAFIFTLLSLKMLFSKAHKIHYYYYSIYLILVSLFVLFINYYYY